MIKRELSWAAMTLLLMLLTTDTAWAWDGQGTEADPYLITNTTDLSQLANNVLGGTPYTGTYFKLTADITYTHSTEWNDDTSTESNFTAIGNSNRIFCGTFDGDGHTISGIRIYKGGYNLEDRYQGLFGYTGSGANIHDLTLADARITGNTHTGGIVGYNDGGTVSRCRVTATVAIHAIQNCDGHGGIAGTNRGTVTQCTSAATLTIVKTSCNNYGGIVGYNRGTLTDNLTFRATIPATANGNYGAIAGENTGTLQRNYYYGCKVAAQENAEGVGCNNADIQDDDAAYPARFISSDNITYDIFNVGGWYVFCECLQDNDTYNGFSGKTVRLRRSMTVNRMAGSDSKPFCGTFDGLGYTLTFNYSGSEDFIAPFAYTTWNTTPVFRNLTISGTINTTGNYAAGLIGHLFGTVTIEHCTSTIDITSASGAGGFVGLCEHTVNFADCKSSAVIHSAGGNNSGFVGWSRASGHEINFTGCIFNGKLLQKDNSGNSNGGFIGWTGSNKTVSITNCLCAPTTPASGETMASGNSATFARGWNGTTTATNSYYFTALGTAQGKQARSITAGENVTVVNAGTPETIYTTSGITSNGTGIKYNNVLYAGENDNVSLTLSNTLPSGCVFNNYTVSPAEATLAGNGNPYTLTMPDADVTVSVVSHVSSLLDYNNDPLADGSAEHPYVIGTTDGWNFFCDCLLDGAWNGFSGKTVKLGADIEVSRMAGSSDHKFKGTFDGSGQQYTLTFNHTATAENAAPFAYVDGATIGNLHIAGAIKTSAKYAAGITAHTSGTTAITNCRSSIVVSSSVNGDGTHGGLVGVEDNGTLTITGCLFDGKLLTTNGTNNCGGFVGWKNGTLNIENSIYAPAACDEGETEVLAGSGQYMSQTFARIDATITNCYYTRILGNAQGKQMHSISGGEGVTVAFSGNATAYSVSDITAYNGNRGLLYGGTCHAGNGDEVSLTLGTASGYTAYGYTASAGTLAGNDNDGYTLAMPDEQVVITANANPTVTYFDMNGTEQQCIDYTILTGMESTLAAGWYVAYSDINYTGTITLTGDVHLILCDNHTMNIGSVENPISGKGIDGSGHSLTIYGQTNQSGALGICNDAPTAVELNNYSQHGGNVTVAIGIICGNVCFTRGSLAANGGIDGDVTLDWNNAADCFYADAVTGNVSIATGKAFADADGTSAYSGNSVNGIDGKTLQPAVTVNLNDGITAVSGIITSGDSHYARVGETVTVYAGSVTAPEGYTLADGITVTSTDGPAPTVSDLGDDTYSFTVPAADVTVGTALALIDWATQNSGEESDPYIIYNKDQLDLLAQRVNNGTSDFSNTYFMLGADIVYPHGSSTTENNYTAIGNNNRAFKGHFDGNGHTVSGIRIYHSGNGDADMYQGLFGKTDGADIHDLTLADAHITGYDDTGGIVGANAGTIARCHIAPSVTIHAVMDYNVRHGGIAGYNYKKGTITQCTSAVTLTYASSINNTYGAIVGLNWGTLTENLAIGATVSAATSDYHGAIAGYNNNNGTLAHNYYVNCTVGGVANATGKGCYNADVTTNDGAVPGIILYDNSKFDINSYILTTVGNVEVPRVVLSGRTLYKDDSWNTLCLPFSLDAAQVAAQLAPDALMTLKTSDFSGGTLTLTFEDATEIAAGKPYIIKWSGDGSDNLVNPTFTGVTISNATASVETDYVDFIGTYDPTDIYTEEKTNLYLGDDNKLCYPNANLNINACRAYFQLAENLYNPDLGDVNGDGNINITDVIFMVNHILGQNNDDFIIANADMDQSGGIDISDVVRLVNIILNPDTSNKVTRVVSNVGITYDSSGSGSAR